MKFGIKCHNLYLYIQHVVLTYNWPTRLPNADDLGTLQNVCVLQEVGVFCGYASADCIHQRELHLAPPRADH